MLQEKIEKKVKQALDPVYLEVINESAMHHVPAGAETHFRLVVVSRQFEGRRLVERHQWLNRLLSEELKNQIHALSMQTFSPKEWEEKKGTLPKTPLCLGGSKK